MDARTVEPRGRLWDCTFEEYLADREHWSNTTLGDLLEKGPRYAWLRQTGQLVVASTDALTVGSMTHAAVWEGTQTLDDRYLIVEKRIESAKKKAAAQGKVAVLQSMYDQALAIGKAIARAAVERAEDGDTFLADLLAAPGRREQSFAWSDSETGVLLRGRADKLLEEYPLIVDLKTAKAWRPEWESWLRDARKYGYHRQAWLYSDAYEAIYGRRPRFIHIVVHNEPPYEVGVYELGESELELGMMQCRRAMREVAERLESGVWHDPAERGVQGVYYPHFVFQDEEMAR